MNVIETRATGHVASKRHLHRTGLHLCSLTRNARR
jgi:hypothetical protein